MTDDLRAKYGAEAIDAGITLQGKGFEKRLAQRDALDPHITKSWLDYQITGLGQRPALDTRTSTRGARNHLEKPAGVIPMCKPPVGLGTRVRTQWWPDREPEHRRHVSVGRRSK